MTTLIQNATQDTASVAAAFANAVASRDEDAVRALLAEEVRFRYLIPPGPNQADGPAGVAAAFTTWFGDATELHVTSTVVEPMSDRTSLRYHLRVHRCGQWQQIEQQIYLDVDENGLISALDLLCSGFRPDAEAADALRQEHRFDATTLGCADGLAQEFRRRILSIPIGDLLLVETSDPAAKQDLPPLARLMGHKVHSTEPTEDGRLLVKVERGR